MEYDSSYVYDSGDYTYDEHEYDESEEYLFDDDGE